MMLLKMTVIVAPAALIVLSVVVVVIYFHCLKIGANADGSDILVMNPFRYILREVWIGVGDKTYTIVGPSTEVKVDCNNILKISDGIIKLFCWPEYCAHIPENAAEGDLVIGGVGTSLDMLQKIDRATKMQVISCMVWGDCAFVK